MEVGDNWNNNNKTKAITIKDKDNTNIIMPIITMPEELCKKYNGNQTVPENNTGKMRARKTTDKKENPARRNLARNHC